MENYKTINLPTHSNKKVDRLLIEEILYLESDSNYTIFHMQNGIKKISPRTMGFHINQSPTDVFIRIHRGHCVNRLHIADYNKHLEPDTLFLKGGKSLSVSRRQQSALNKAIMHPA